MWCILNFLGRSYFPGEAIFGEKPFTGEKPLSKTLLPLPCKELEKNHLTLIQEKSDLLVKNVPNNFLRRSHSPVPYSLFHKRKSVVPFKDSKNSNLISTFSLLHHFWLWPLLLFVFKYVFKYVLIFEIIDYDLTENIWNKKRKLLSCQSYFQIVLSRQLLWQS